MSATVSSVPDEFWQRLRGSGSKVLLLDYDGTLAPFQENRFLAVPYLEVRPVLNQIQANTATRLVIISGRGLTDLIPLLGLESQPELWGCHGWEQMLPDGTHRIGQLPDAIRNRLDQAIEQAWCKGLLQQCEIKPTSVALHWRGWTEAKILEVRHTITAIWQPLTKHGALALHDFDGGLELRLTGIHKGKVIEQILTRENRNAVIAYLGDDRTDEDAFKALGDRGLSVLVRPRYRPTAAAVHLVPPQGLLRFLHTWLRCCTTTPDNLNP